MNNHLQIFLVVIFFALSPSAYAGNEVDSSSPEEVVLRYFKYLKEGDVSSISSLFFTIPIMEKSKDAWLKLITKVSNKATKEQLAWEVLCSKELVETAVVLVNQTMKQGKPQSDPDGVILVKEHNNWLLLPDALAKGLTEDVRIAISKNQLEERHTLTSWAKEEIRRLTWTKGKNGEYSAKCNQSK